MCRMVSSLSRQKRTEDAVWIHADIQTDGITQQWVPALGNVGMYLSLTGAGKGVPVTHDSTHHSIFGHSRAEVLSRMGFNYKRGWRYAAYDKIVFQKWYDGRISAEKAISEIAENNQCDKISVEEFIKCAEELGYARNIGSKEIQTGTEEEKTEKSV